MTSNSEELKLFLCEKESQDGDERWLDIEIKLFPEDYWDIRKEITLTIPEIKELVDLSSEDFVIKLFSKFGVTDLKSYAGLPKGPYYWIDKGVRDAMVGLVKSPKRGRTEKLFSVIDEFERAYPGWEYTTHEAALALFDVNSNHFAMVSYRREVAEETSVYDEYRDTSHYRCYLYSKSTLAQIDRFEHRKKENLIDEMRKLPWGSCIKEVESIMVNAGRVYILDGNLVLDKIQSS